METLRGISTGCFPVTWASCSSVMPSTAGGGNAEFGTDFVAFSSSWPSCCLLPSFMHGMSQLSSDLWDVTELEGSRSIVQGSHYWCSSLQKERGCNYLFSVIFLSRASRSMSGCSKLRDRCTCTFQTENRGHGMMMFTDPWTSGKHHFAVF